MLYYFVHVGNNAQDIGVNFESYSIQPNVRGEYHYFELNDKGVAPLKKLFELIRKNRSLMVTVPPEYTNAMMQFNWARDKKTRFSVQIDLMQTFDDGNDRPPVVMVIETNSSGKGANIARLELDGVEVRSAWRTELGVQEVYLAASHAAVRLAF